MKLYGLVGHPLAKSFSKDIFNTKFKTENLDCHYINFDIEDISDIKETVASNKDLCGFNVTIPYKQSIMAYLDFVSESATEVGAVNTVKIENGKLIGFNTDVIGFERLFEKATMGTKTTRALVLGSGGASKSVAYVLRKRGIPFQIVSRSNKGDLTYKDLNKGIIETNDLIINTTPLGMYSDEKPEIPYQFINNKHVCIDLVYNPPTTPFMKKAAEQGATVANGMEMLIGQAEAAWDIWNDKQTNNL